MPNDSEFETVYSMSAYKDKGTFVDRVSTKLIKTYYTNAMFWFKFEQHVLNTRFVSLIWPFYARGVRRAFETL